MTGRALQGLLAGSLLFTAVISWREADSIRWGLTTLGALLSHGSWGTVEERIAGIEGRKALISGRLEEAESLLRASLAVDPRAEFRHDLARCLVARGRAPEAEAELARYLGDFPLDGIAHAELAELERRRGAPGAQIRARLEHVERELRRVRAEMPAVTIGSALAQAKSERVAKQWTDALAAVQAELAQLP